MFFCVRDVRAAMSRCNWDLRPVDVKAASQPQLRPPSQLRSGTGEWPAALSLMVLKVP